jgi:predicted DNA-binding transcriptional regulator AlpA
MTQGRQILSLPPTHKRRTAHSGRRFQRPAQRTLQNRRRPMAADRTPRPALLAELLRDREAAVVWGVSVRQWWKLVAMGHAPKPVAVPGMRGTRWRRHDLLDAIAELKQE